MTLIVEKAFGILLQITSKKNIFKLFLTIIIVISIQSINKWFLNSNNKKIIYKNWNYIQWKQGKSQMKNIKYKNNIFSLQ